MKLSLALVTATLAASAICAPVPTQEETDIQIPEEAIDKIIPLGADEYPIIAKHGDESAIIIVNGTTLDVASETANEIAKRDADADARKFGFRWTRYGWFEPLAKKDQGSEDSGLAKRDAEADARAFGFRWTRYGWFEPLAKRDEGVEEEPQGLAKREADARKFGFRWTRYGWFEPLAKRAQGSEDAVLAKRDAVADARKFGFRWTRYGWFEPLA
ncbi:uncharacterized protein J8A68_005181 [[Candida] subhashii]|uniref:Mating factor alpha precursor N-terminal domain-containing protein n=1 Tax=[Candida] subhashii TaxID=561895 RepID=A0A8J5Q3V8_9ASCO|nr:uncharacterized protein J8A68_005181 [[Candida] subhashii]KAG7661289.1 hypothetical protein J8A68_005181 [[Candida] subhashii]